MLIWHHKTLWAIFLLHPWEIGETSFSLLSHSKAHFRFLREKNCYIHVCGVRQSGYLCQPMRLCGPNESECVPKHAAYRNRIEKLNHSKVFKFFSQWHLLHIRRCVQLVIIICWFTATMTFFVLELTCLCLNLKQFTSLMREKFARR